MKHAKILNTTRGVYLADDAGLATGLLGRGLGLMFRKTLAEGSGLVLMPEGQVHMFFMRFPLDIIHADAHGTVLRVVHALKPWRLGPLVRKSRMVIELPAGTAARTGTQVGDTLTLEDSAG